MILEYTPLIVSCVTLCALFVQVCLVLVLLGALALRNSGNRSQPVHKEGRDALDPEPAVYVLSYILVVVSDEENKSAPESERLNHGIIKHGFVFLTNVSGVLDMAKVMQTIMSASNATDIVIISMSPLPAGTNYVLPLANTIDTSTIK